MIYFLLSFSMLREKPFSASKYAKDVLPYRKGIPYCFVQQTTAFHKHGSKCCSMEILNELTYQKHMKKFEAYTTYFHKNTFVSSILFILFSFSLYFA